GTGDARGAAGGCGRHGSGGGRSAARSVSRERPRYDGPVSEKRHAIAPDRNREPILAVLQEVLPPAGTVLEIGSGTGQHAVFYADKFPSIVWQPSDVDADALDSIAAWRGEAALPNLRPPIHLDARAEVWDTEPVSAIVAINVVHISPWATCVGMLTGAG